jgi:VWFA-related protein
MKKVFLTLLVQFILAQIVFSQKPQPSQTPVSEVDDDVVRISTNLVQIDVTVAGKDGKVITDLKPEDFEIFENGQKQEISNFSFISASSATVDKTSKTDPKKEILPPSKIRLEQVRRTIALVVDDLTLSFESTYYVRRALRNFVEKQMEDGDLVAIIRTGAGIGALQQFTNDKRMLLAAIEKIRWNASGAGGVGAFAPIERGFDTGAENSDENSDEKEPDTLAEMNDFREQLFATGTLGAVNYIIRGMKDLPGRKSIMLLSDGFSLFSETSGGFRETNSVMNSLRLLVDLANRSSVVVYTLDARGLVTTGLTAADDTSELSGSQIESQISSRKDKLFNTQEGLIYLAKQTGGLPIINNNDLAGGIRKILDDQSYYLIGYQPDAATFDPAKRRFNKLEVKVKRNGANVRYRSGFFGVNDEDIRRPTNLTTAQKLLSALSSPFGVSDINLSLNTLFKSDAKKNASLSSFVHINLQDLTFTETLEGKKAMFDIIAVNFGDNGAVMDEISKTYTLNVKKESYGDFLKDKFVYFFSFPVKKPGAYQMRVAIRDHASDKLGSASQFIEVPKLSKNKLTLSGAALESLTLEQWQNEIDTGTKQVTDPMADTAIRMFKRGSVLRYGLEIYNAKTSPNRSPQLMLYSRVFRDGKLIHDGKPQPIDMAAQNDPQIVTVAGALALGKQMLPGDYVLQIVVIDSQAKKKNQTATQVVQFEIID